MLVVDAVIHGFDLDPKNVLPGRYGEMVVESLLQGQGQMILPPYRLDHDRMRQTADADVVESVVFEETPVDVAFYHPVLIRGAFRRGMSPFEIGVELQRRRPEQVHLLGAVNLFDGPDAISELRQQAADHPIVGVKVYPVDLQDGELRTVGFDDREIVYPFLEACLEMGIRHVAVHKAVPLGTSPRAAFDPSDVGHAATDFPDLTFEIVHGGFAFLDETASLLDRFPNVYANLETTGDLLPRYPGRFAEILGELLFWGGPEKVLWGTGATGAHPRPLLEEFCAFQFPDDLVARRGLTPLTQETREAILSGNTLRCYGIDEQQVLDAALQREEARADLRPPWDRLPDVGVAP